MSEVIREKKLTVIDTETTGFSPGCGDRVCEIGLVQIKDWKVINSYGTFINPGRKIPPQARAVHSITDEMVREAPCFEDIAERLKEMIGESVLVFHNAPFDLGFINAELVMAGHAPLDNKVVDTLRILRNAFNFPSNALSSITARLDIPHSEKHRALSDAMVTMEVLKYIVRNLRPRTLPELLQYC